jgi:Fic family protein
MARIPETFNKIQLLRSRYYSALSGKESLIKTINEAEIPEHVYNSNAIENSTLSLEETEKILLEIDLERFVTAREIHEAKNLARVTAYVEEKAPQEVLTLDLILLLHKMLIGNIDESMAGRLREGEEWVRVGSYIAPAPAEVASQLPVLISEYLADTESHIITRIACFHLGFEHIHPFCDGNGRIGRVLNNYLLLREGYVPINIAFADRARYYDAFKEFDVAGRVKIMEEIVGRALTESYHKRLAYLEGKRVVLLKEFAAQENMSYSNALNKSERQTIEAFQEKGNWKMGV